MIVPQIQRVQAVLAVLTVLQVKAVAAKERGAKEESLKQGNHREMMRGNTQGGEITPGCIEKVPAGEG